MPRSRQHGASLPHATSPLSPATGSLSPATGPRPGVPAPARSSMGPPGCASPPPGPEGAERPVPEEVTGLAAAVLGFAVGIALQPWLSHHLGWVALAGLALVVALLCGIASSRAGHGAIALAFILPGTLRALAAAPHLPPTDIAHHAPRRFIHLQAVVATPPARTKDAWRLRLSVQRPAPGLVEATFPGPRRPGVGTLWDLTGRLDRPGGPANPGESDRAARLARQGVFATFRGEHATPMGPAPGWAPQRLLDHLRLRLLNGLAAGLPTDKAALFGSLVLGTGASPVDPQLAENFRDVGLSHLLAASGAQVGMLAASGYAATRWLGLAPPWAAGLTLPGLLLYLALTGAPASMVRATWMGAVSLGALAAGRSTAPFVALWLAAGAMLVTDPGALQDLGFQFSFLATYALCRLATRPVRRNWLLTSLAVSWAANMWVLPWQLYVFGQGTWLALPANLLTEPLVLALTPWGVGVAAVGAVCPPLARLVSPLTSAALALLTLIVNAFAAVPWGAFFVPALAPACVALWYLGLWLGRRRLPIALAAAAAVQALPGPAAGQLEVAVLSVGQGDGIAIRAPDDRWAVLDAGPAFDDHDAGSLTVLPYLRREGCRRVDLMIASHAHLDHLGGLPAIEHALPVARAWDPGQLDPGRPYRTLLAGYLSDAVPCAIADPTLQWSAGGATLQVLSRPAPQVSLNDGSIVTMLRYGRFRMLFTGDAEAAGEARLLASGADLRATVLKVGHHGSHTSSTAAFLAAVQPRLALISVGRHNRFNHPDPAIVGRLAATGARVERTDEAGALLVRSDGTRAWLATGKDGWQRWEPVE